MKTVRILVALIMAVVYIGLSSCSKDDYGKNGSTDDLVGKWERIWTKGWEMDSDGFKEEWDEADSGYLYYIFKNDGTGYEMQNNNENMQPYIWELNGNKLTLTYERYEDIYKVETLNRSTLTITISEDDETDTSTYKKIAN